MINIFPKTKNISEKSGVILQLAYLFKVCWIEDSWIFISAFGFKTLWYVIIVIVDKYEANIISQRYEIGK